MQYINFRFHSRVAATILAAGSLLVAQTPSKQSVPDPAAPGGSAAGNSSGQGSTTSSSKTDSHGQAGSQFTETEKTFVQEALEGGRHEIEMGKMASKQSSDPNVKAYGKKLVSDHSAANKKLESLAKKNMAGMTHSKSAMASDSELMSAKGPDFDKAFAAKAVEDHQKDIAKFEAAEKDATNPDLKAFITSTLPTLRDHLQQAQSLTANAGASTSSSSSGSSSSTPGASTNPGSTRPPSGSPTPGSTRTPSGSPTPGSPTPGSPTPGSPTPGSSTNPNPQR